MSRLFSPLTIRSVTLPNRIGISPMCQYSSTNGFANDWHLIHLGSRALGGAGMVMTEAAAVTPEGRISSNDLGIWDDKHIPELSRVASAIRNGGAVPAIQIAHAGRKAGTHRPWDGSKPLTLEEGLWRTVGPSAIPFDAPYPIPAELTIAEIGQVQTAFVEAARRSLEAGFAIVEIHGAHGYLISSFLSSTSNQRTDSYGGSFGNRIRFLTETVTAVRTVWPADKPLFVRISSVEWVEGGWTIEDSVRLARVLAGIGVDLIDCSSGGNNHAQQVELGPGYQVPFAAAIRSGANISTAAVGLITGAAQAEEILANEQTDLILLGRESLRSPYWPLQAAHELGDREAVWTPPQYGRAW
jgi:2,4-dienoyl-CoA reductase-like NADH-dependent reductase (Old Yellow Enzyme family)